MNDWVEGVIGEMAQRGYWMMARNAQMWEVWFVKDGEGPGLVYKSCDFTTAVVGAIMQLEPDLIPESATWTSGK